MPTMSAKLRYRKAELWSDCELYLQSRSDTEAAMKDDDSCDMAEMKALADASKIGWTGPTNASQSVTGNHDSTPPKQGTTTANATGLIEPPGAAESPSPPTTTADLAPVGQVG